MKLPKCFRRLFLILLAVMTSCSTHPDEVGTINISESVLRDKITGGIIGQFFGNLNGLEHENKYTDDPGNVTEYTPDLSGGAITDDDTDIEYVYIYHMLESGRIILPYDTIFHLWKKNINDRIWCSNRYARNLMDIGIMPPFTGRMAFNPWAGFNISGQFLCEQFGLISPGMPLTAAGTGVHYTHVAIDGEPAQTTQLYDAMIATAFFEDDITDVIRAGLASVDPSSEIFGIVSKVISWFEAHPDDWRETRLSIKENYWSGEFGGPGGTNGYRVITASTIASLLYGKGDFVESLRLAFNFGWDADNVAAMVGTIMGIIKGEKWIRVQGWPIRNIYTNDRRPGLPSEMTITEFADMHLRLAERNILEQGGDIIYNHGEKGYRIKAEEPSNIEALPNPIYRYRELKSESLPLIEAGLGGDSTEQLYSVYMAVCLGIVEEVSENRKAEWMNALQLFEPQFETFFGDENWSPAARHYFYETVKNNNTQLKAPFGYEIPVPSD